MNGLVDWATARARMVFAFILLSIAAGTVAYVGLPKEGEPDIDVPALFVSVQFPGISATDSEKLLVRPLESELRDVEGLDKMTATAAEGYAIVVLEFEFGWDKAATLAEVRDRVSQAEGDFPDGVRKAVIDEINFSEFPILVVSLSGSVPERTLLRIAKDLQNEVQGLAPVLEAGLAGHREEMLEVLIDPLRLESYNVTADELLRVVTANNALIAAGEVESGSGAFSVKIPSSFDEPRDIYDLPVKVNGDSVITLGNLADIRLTFEDARGTARFNGEPTIALQIVKRKGENLIDTVDAVKAKTAEVLARWPAELRTAVTVSYSMDDSVRVDGMVSQLESSVLTAIALVMVVVLASLGIRSALLVGFSIPTTFLLTFALLAMFGMSISNIVMFGLILAVGMLVDGGIVIVEYADTRIAAGVGPMRAFGESAKRMFWPVVSSTATTLCAFLPMLFWPGIPGEFMGNLPVTLIFVLSASLVVALIYTPVMGGIAGRISRLLDRGATKLRARLPFLLRLVVLVGFAMLAVLALAALAQKAVPLLPGGAVLILAFMGASMAGAALRPAPGPAPVGEVGYRRSLFGRVIHAIVGNPVMPLVAIGGAVGFMMATFAYFGEHSKGVEFFVKLEPERGVAYVRARGNLSLEEKDRLVQLAEAQILGVAGIESVFSFTGAGGLNQNRNGSATPLDEVGRVQFELAPWGKRAPGDEIIAEIDRRLATIPGILVEVANQEMGPAQGKPVHLRLTGDGLEELETAVAIVRAKLEATEGIIEIDDTRALPGIDWQIDVDVGKAGRYGADVATVGAMIQLVTRGILLDTMRTDTSDEEVEIRVRFPEKDRVLTTLDSLRVRTRDGLVPLSNFITRTPVPKVGQINRFNSDRYLDVKADVAPGLVRWVQPREGVEIALGTLRALGAAEIAATPAAAPRIANAETGEVWEVVATGPGGMLQLEAAFAAGEYRAIPITVNDRIDLLTAWLTDESPLPAGVKWQWTGDREQQEESQAFLGQAFAGALGLMFVILLAQFNSVYNSVLVLTAVVMSVTGVLIGMLVMDQTFSIIMTGTGIVALAGIVVNNNIILIDTYQEYSRYLHPLEAITRTAEARIRPVLLTTITTMAGLTPMMFAISVDFWNGGYTIAAPTALWWRQLATAVVFGLGIATVLTLVVTPAALALRYWVTHLAASGLVRLFQIGGAEGRRDRALRRAASRTAVEDVAWARPAPPRRMREPEPRQLDAAE